MVACDCPFNTDDSPYNMPETHPDSAHALSKYRQYAYDWTVVSVSASLSQ